MVLKTGLDRSIKVPVRSDEFDQKVIEPVIRLVNQTNRSILFEPFNSTFFYFFPNIKTTSFWCSWHKKEAVLMSIKSHFTPSPPPQQQHLPWLSYLDPPLSLAAWSSLRSTTSHDVPLNIYIYIYIYIYIDYIYFKYFEIILILLKYNLYIYDITNSTIGPTNEPWTVNQ